jgi:hypothetical protein
VPWLLGFVGLIVRGFYLQLQTLDNIAPGQSWWRPSFSFV